VSSKKRRRIADNHQRSSERVEARHRAAAEADEACHREDLSAWERVRAIVARSAKLSAPDSDDGAEADHHQNPFSAHSFIPSGQPRISTQGVVCSATTTDGGASSIASALVPGSVAPSPTTTLTKLPVALSTAVSSTALIVSPSTAPAMRPSQRRKCVRPPFHKESSSKSGDGDGEETVTSVPEPLSQVLPGVGVVSFPFPVLEKASIGAAGAVDTARMQSGGHTSEENLLRVSRS